MSTLYRWSGYTDAEYAVLSILGYRVPCQCFDRNGLYEGHNVNPPCEGVQFARQIVKAVKSADDTPIYALKSLDTFDVVGKGTVFTFKSVGYDPAKFTNQFVLIDGYRYFVTAVEKWGFDKEFKTQFALVVRDDDE